MADPGREPAARETPASGKATASLFAGPGECRALYRAFDWGSTSLGAVARWPAGLKAAARLCLDARSPMAVFAGRERLIIYNEGYPPVLGRDRHPWAFGRPAREVWAELWHWLGPELDRVIEEGQPTHHVDHPIVLPRNGRDEETFFTYSFTPIREDDGSVHGALLVFQETTARLRALSESEQFLSFALGTAGMGAWSLDLVTHTVLRSLDHDRIFGYEQGLPEWTYDTFLAHVIPEDRARVEETFRTARARLADWRFECRIRRRDGALRWIWVAGRHHPEPDGLSRRMAGIVQDITARKQHEAELRDADRRKDEYLAMLGHELRNPLGAIRNAADLLERSRTRDKVLRQTYEVLNRQSAHMSRIIDGLLDVSRIARGKITLEVAPLDLRAVVDRVVEVRIPQAIARGLALVRDVAPEPVFVLGDEARLVQVVDNLVGNAIKFTPRGGAITASVMRRGDCGVIRIRDTGVGLDPEAIERIFEPFHQERNEIARTAGGLGLGLALAKRLLDLHHGTIVARSAGPARGAEFEVRLPLTRTTPTHARAIHDRARPKHRILVVEDNVDAAEMLRLVLERAGHAVTVAGSGNAALELLPRVGADVVFCDLGLPGMSGYDLARAIRRSPSLREIPLIALTGYGQPADRRQSAEAGFDDHLVKPVDLALLGEVLQRVALRSL